MDSHLKSINNHHHCQQQYKLESSWSKDIIIGTYHRRRKKVEEEGNGSPWWTKKEGRGNAVCLGQLYQFAAGGREHERNNGETKGEVQRSRAGD